jgi:DNA-directed RNA polymerase specialized sigma24 family protein
MTRTELDWLAEQFEEHRSHLRAVAYRMLGSLSEADDAVQDTWPVATLLAWAQLGTRGFCLRVRPGSARLD